MPPSIRPFRIVCSVIFALLLFSVTVASAQTDDDPCSTGEAIDCHTVSFRFGDYDVISNIYIFLTSGTQQTSCKLEIVSIQRRSGSGWLLPSPISLDLLFRAAVNAHYQQGHLPCAEQGERVPLQAILSDSDGLEGILFTLFSLLHLSDQWSYAVECGNNTISIEFLEFITDLLFD